MKKEDKAKKIRELIEQATITALSDENIHDVIDNVKDNIEGAIKKRMLEIVGLDRSWHEIKIKRDSALEKKIDAIVKNYLDTVEFKSPVVTQKDIKIANGLFQKAYIRTLKELADKEGCRRAREEFDNFKLGE